MRQLQREMILCTCWVCWASEGWFQSRDRQGDQGQSTTFWHIGDTPAQGSELWPAPWRWPGMSQVLSASPALGSHANRTGAGTAASSAGSTCGGADHAPHRLPTLHQLLHRVQAPLPMLLNIFHLGRQGATVGCRRSPCLGQGTGSAACPPCSSPIRALPELLTSSQSCP